MEQRIIDRIAKENVFINDYDVEFHSSENTPGLDKGFKMWFLFKKKSTKKDQQKGTTLITVTGIPDYVVTYFEDKKRLLLTDKKLNIVLIREDF